MKQRYPAGTTLPAPPTAPVPAAEEVPALLIHDLLMDFDELKGLLGKELYRSGWLDAFLLAAGMNQILEDYLHRDFAELERVVKTVAAVPLLGILAAAASKLRAVGLAARALSRKERRLIAWE